MQSFMVLILLSLITYYVKVMYIEYLLYMLLILSTYLL